MKQLWKENDGFRLLVWTFGIFFVIAGVWLYMEEKLGWGPELPSFYF